MVTATSTTNSTTGGTYDPLSGVYISPSGQGFSMKPENVPLGTTTVVRPSGSYQGPNAVGSGGTVGVPNTTSIRHPTPSAETVIGTEKVLKQPQLDTAKTEVIKNVVKAEQQQKDIYVSDTGLLFTVQRGQSPYSSYGPNIQPTPPQVERPSPKTQPNTTPNINQNFLQRFEESQKGYSIFGKNGLSVSGTLQFAGQEVARYVPNQPISLLDLQGQRVRGTATNFNPNVRITPQTLLTPQEYSELVLSKTESTKAGASMTVQSLPYILAGVGGAAYSGGASALLFISGAEQYFTPKGQAQITETSKSIGPIAYVIPAVEIGLGAYGVRQAYIGSQVEALKSVKPEVQVGQPYQVNNKLFLEQQSEQKIPYPGMIYKTRPFTPEPTIEGSQFISPRITTPIRAQLTISEEGGYKFIGAGRTGASVIDPFTGLSKKLISQPYVLSGYIQPAESGRLINPELGLKAYSIDQPFYGKTVLETKPTIKETFAGFPVRESKTGTIEVISGKTSGLKYYPVEDVYRTTLKPKTIGFILPEKEGEAFKYFTFPKGTQAQLIIGYEKPESIIDYYIPTRVNPKTELLTGIGQSVGRLGPQTISVSPVYSFNIPSLTLPFYRQTPLVYQKTEQVTRQVNIPRQISIPKIIESPAQSFIQTPKQAQLQKEIIVEKFVEPPRSLPSIPTPFIPIPNIGFPSFPVLLKEERKKSKKKITRRKFKEDLYYTPSFTARILGIRQVIPKGKFYKTASEVYSPIALRGVPKFK